MKKKLLCIALAFVFTVGLGLTAQAEDLALPAPSCILMEKDTGQILYEENAHEKLRPASVTKIMTLLLVLEALDNGSIGWDDTVTTSAAAAAKGGSQIYLEENEQLPLREMLKSVVVSSANDCACALAEHVAGSEAAFVSRMNDRAAELGMTDTHFVNCTGLDDGPDADTHLTTAYDIALMSCALLKHEEIKEYTTIWMDTVRNGQFGLSNTNKLVRFYDGTTGLKTGYTSAAGYCLSASAERGGMELVAVVLHCKNVGRPVRIGQSAAQLRLFRLRPRHAAAGGRHSARPGRAGAAGFHHARTGAQRAASARKGAGLAGADCGYGRRVRAGPCRSRAAARHNDRHGGRAAACRNSARRAGGRPRPHVSGALGGVFEKHLPVRLIIFDRGRALPCISGPRAGTRP